MIRVLLVDGHALVRAGLSLLLAKASEAEPIEVVGEAGSGEQACADYARLQADVVVMELNLPGMGGLEAVRRLLAQDPKARVLALSAQEDTGQPRRALRAGALGFVAKRSTPEVLIAAVAAVSRGKRYLDATTAQAMALAQISGDAEPAELLSEREFAVFLQLARGLSVAQIAANLKLSASTIGTHLYNVKLKLKAANQSELTLAALRWGLIEP